MKAIGIFGTSGFAGEVDDIAHELGWRTIFVARDAAELTAWTGDDEVILDSDALRYADMPFAIGIGNAVARQTVWQRFRDDLKFVNLIHPAASFGKHQRQAIEARTGVVVAAGARFMSQVMVGDFTVFDLNATVGHDTVVEHFVHVAPGVNISGNVHIGARCWIGTGAAINQGRDGRKLTIGADTVIGSGSVVVKDCEPSSVYVGNPARKIK
jgi:sugar O-acyltransferase (sialic acid O-acetyltransferase NeuD family)